MVWEEGAFRFEFGDNWHVIKLDVDPHYRQGIEKLDGTKALDFIGVFANRDLYLIEVKNFRGYRIENKERILTGALALEIGHKVRDSVACLVGAYRTATIREKWQPVIQRLLDPRSTIKVVVWITQDLPRHQSFNETKAQEVVFLKQLKTKLRLLTYRVFLVNLESTLDQLPDVEIHNLPAGKS